MKKILYSLMAATALTFTPAAFAADTAAPAASVHALSVVNIQQIMRESTAAQNVREQLESKQKTFQSEFAKKDEALKKEEQELGKQRGVLSKAAFEEKVTKFRAKVTDVQKESQSKKAILDSAFEHALNDIQKAVTDIISDLAKEKGFAITIPTSQTLYSDAKLDITNDVLTRLNQKMPKLEVKFDSETAAPAADKKAKDKK